MVAMNVTGLVFEVAPQDQGQMVERAWAIDGENGCFIRRVSDGSTRTVEYFRHEFTESFAGSEEEYCSANGSPIVQGFAEKSGRQITV